ncbi:hypothetical protein PCG10_004208 [Penicillium crustosum]|uniref:Uncharacterized protein n=1 Tax=Penicillium crustosum TaxID=36656 RepID=A0A9P5KZ84_PENCR|nr:uncharacterized protein N7487_005537 [Penicillium crustosum]KAF7526272.1 hypothetical protein PCG10_004208 [Penicillium crustosum]KAJ5411178.1 hypothetical protein N7487_005537 [Penicillium crustosum]
MAEASAVAPPPPKSNKEKKKEWCAAVKKGKRERKKARRTRIDAIFNDLLNKYNAMGSADQSAADCADAIRVLRETAEALGEERNPHTHVKKK